jgi:hypothetical protein
MPVHMDISLRERYCYFILVKRKFDILVHVENDIPIILAFAPDTGLEIHRAVSQFLDYYLSCRILQYLFVFLDDFLYYLACLLYVISVSYSSSRSLTPFSILCSSR